MERQNKRSEHKESRLCVSGIRIRFRWEFIGKFIYKQDTEIEKTRKKVKLPFGFHLKFSPKRKSSILTYTGYVNEHTDRCSLVESRSQSCSFPTQFTPFLTLGSSTRSTIPVLEIYFFFHCHASGKFLLITHQACQWRDGSN